jgi:hypothetical protein
MKVKHGEHVVVFAVFDQDVKKLAMETCPLLISMVSDELIDLFCLSVLKSKWVVNVLQGESFSLYPDEMECFYGDAYLCRVEGRDPVDFDDLPAFNVISICSETGVVNKFFDHYISDADKFISIIDFSFNCYLFCLLLYSLQSFFYSSAD